MRLYLGGKMIGVPGFGFAAFDEAADKLRAKGHEVFNPAERDRGVGFNADGLAGTYDEVLSQGFDRRGVLRADWDWIGRNSEGMIALDNWLDSPGTISEIAAHQALYLPVWPLHRFLRDGEAATKLLPLRSMIRFGQ